MHLLKTRTVVVNVLDAWNKARVSVYIVGDFHQPAVRKPDGVTALYTTWDRGEIDILLGWDHQKELIGNW